MITAFLLGYILDDGKNFIALILWNLLAEHHNIGAYHPQFRMLTPAEAADLKAHDVKINTWTVNEVEDIREMIRIGVDGIISNYPDCVAAELKNAGLR